MLPNEIISQKTEEITRISDEFYSNFKTDYPSLMPHIYSVELSKILIGMGYKVRIDEEMPNHLNVIIPEGEIEIPVTTESEVRDIVRREVRSELKERLERKEWEWKQLPWYKKLFVSPYGTI